MVGPRRPSRMGREAKIKRLEKGKVTKNVLLKYIEVSLGSLERVTDRANAPQKRTEYVNMLLHQCNRTANYNLLKPTYSLQGKGNSYLTTPRTPTVHLAPIVPLADTPSAVSYPCSIHDCSSVCARHEKASANQPSKRRD